MTYSDIRRAARENLQNNWGLSIGACLLAAIMGGMLIGSSFLPQLNIHIENQDIESWEQFFRVTLGSTTFSVNTINLIHFILGGVIQLGYAQFLLKQHDGEKAEIHDLFSQFHRFGDGFCLYLLEVVFVFLWSLLLIIPGIIAGFSYAMAPFIMAENENMTASEALRASKELMIGHKWELFCLDFSFIGWNLLGIVTLGISALFVNPYMNAAYAAFYRVISLTDVRSTPEYLPPAEQQ